MPLPALAFAIPTVEAMIATAGGAAIAGSLAYSVHDAILKTRDDIVAFFDEDDVPYNTVKAIPTTKQLKKTDIRPEAKTQIEAKTQAIKNVPAILKQNAVSVPYRPVAQIEKPTAATSPAVATVGTNLVDVMNTKNQLLADNNSLMVALHQIQYAQVEQLEIANKLAEAKFYSDIDMATAKIVMLNEINTTLKAQLEVLQKGSVVQSQDMGKYFSSLATYFEFMNTGKIGTKENFFSNEQESITLKDGETPIIPREAKALKDHELAQNLAFKNKGTVALSDGTAVNPTIAEATLHGERLIDEKRANTIDFAKDLTDLTDDDYGDPFQLIKNLFTLPVGYTLPEGFKDDQLGGV